MPIDDTFTLQSRFRIYTSESQRDQLRAVTGLHGRTTPVTVALSYHSDIAGVTHCEQMAEFDTRLGYYGEIYIPITIPRAFGMSVGEDVSVCLWSRL